MKSDELLKTVRAFLGSMREGDMKGVVANLQAAMEYQAEELRIYRDKYKEATGKDRPELSDDEKRRLARKGRSLNNHLLQVVNGSWSPGTVIGWYDTLITEKYTSTGPGQKKRGRPAVTAELEEAIVKMAKNNPGEYHIVTARVKMICKQDHILTLCGECIIPFKNIVNLNGAIFEDMQISF